MEFDKLDSLLGSTVTKLILHGNEAVDHLTDKEKSAVFMACGCRYSVDVDKAGVLRLVFPDVGLVVVDGKYHASQKVQEAEKEK